MPPDGIGLLDIHLQHDCFKEQIAYPLCLGGAFLSGRVVQTLFADINIEAIFSYTCGKTTAF
jgi:hypothetical protein